MTTKKLIKEKRKREDNDPQVIPAKRKSDEPATTKVCE